MAKKMKIKSIAFNLLDPFEERLFKHTEQFTVFSAYIKRLIQRDLEGSGMLNYFPTVQKPNELDFDGTGFI